MIDPRLAEVAGPAALGPLRVAEFGLSHEEEPSSVVLHRGEFDWEALAHGELEGIWLDADRYDEAELICQAYNAIQAPDEELDPAPSSASRPRPAIDGPMLGRLTAMVGISRSEIARSIGVTPARVSQWVSGDPIPRWHQKELARAIEAAAIRRAEACRQALAELGAETGGGHARSRSSRP